MLFDITAVSQTPAARLKTAIDERSLAMRSYIEDCAAYKDELVVYDNIVLRKNTAMALNITANDNFKKYLEDNIIHKRIRLTQSDEEKWMEIPILEGTYSIYAATPDEVPLIGGFLQRRKADLELLVNEIETTNENLIEAGADENDALAKKLSADSQLRLSRMNALFAGIERRFSYLIFLLARPLDDLKNPAATENM